MENYIVPAAASLAIMILAIISIALSYGRFSQGELKTALGWVLIVLYMLVIPYTGLIVKEAKLLPRFELELSYFIYFGMMIVALLLVRAAWNLYKFSKVFGFKDLRENFAGESSGKTKQKGDPVSKLQVKE